MTRHDPHPAGRARRHPTSRTSHREEVIEMPKNAIRYLSAIHADRAARFQAEAQNARVARRAPRDERRIRRAVGRSIVRIGARIAADPALDRLQPAGLR